MEPGVHQFWPIDITIKGEVIATYYWLVIGNRLDTLAREHLYPPMTKRIWIAAKPPEKSRLVFSTAQIGSHHAWADKHLGLMPPLFSNTFVERLLPLGPTGMMMHQWEEV